MKESIRDAHESFARKARAFVDRRRPEAECRNPISTAEVGALLAGLDEAAGAIPDGRGGALSDAPAFRRKSMSLQVRFEAVKALEQRAPGGGETAPGDDVAAVILDILCTKLRRDVCALAVEALGYYALPMPSERPGDNEAPLGGAYARSLRQGMLARLFESEQALDAQRDHLALRLLKARSPGSTGTEH